MAGYMTGTVIPVDGGLLDRERVDGITRRATMRSQPAGHAVMKRSSSSLKASGRSR